jgi:hypothetical protein
MRWLAAGKKTSVYVASLHRKRLKVLERVDRPDYVDIIESLEV